MSTPIDQTDSTHDDCGRVIVLDIVGLKPKHVTQSRTPALAELLGDAPTTRLRPPFPALTVPVQTTLATGTPPDKHGDVASGSYDRSTDEVEFWGRDRDDRTRLWEAASDEGDLTTGVLFFQHLIGTSADIAITPSPIEDENDELVELNCWSNPDDFYDLLEEEYGHFPLHHFWGPGANEKSSRWILDAARETIRRYSPDLLWIYVPHLDYEGLRSGPSEALRDEVEVVDELVGEFLSFLQSTERWDETAVNVVSEYSFHAVDKPVFPNRALRQADLLSTYTDDGGGLDVDIPASEAFAMVDHQIAHVYVDDDVVEQAHDALAALDGVDAILDDEGKQAHGIDHPNAGDLVLIADADAWFQYYWWTDRADAPSYADDMDIHAKPGFDPCELFSGETGLTSLDPTVIDGSHGRVDDATFGIFGLGGPAAPRVNLPDVIDARTVAPTVAELLGVDGTMEFETSSLLYR